MKHTNKILMILHNEYLQVKLLEQKGLLNDTQQLLMPIKQIQRPQRGLKDRRVKCFLLFVCLFVC